MKSCVDSSSLGQVQHPQRINFPSSSGPSLALQPPLTLFFPSPSASKNPPSSHLKAHIWKWVNFASICCAPGTMGLPELYHSHSLRPGVSSHGRRGAQLHPLISNVINSIKGRHRGGGQRRKSRDTTYRDSFRDLICVRHCAGQGHGDDQPFPDMQEMTRV